MKFLVDILRPQQDEIAYTSIHVCNIGCMRNCVVRLAQVYFVRQLEVRFHIRRIHSGSVVQQQEFDSIAQHECE